MERLLQNSVLSLFSASFIFFSLSSFFSIFPFFLFILFLCHNDSRRYPVVIFPNQKLYHQLQGWGPSSAVSASCPGEFYTFHRIFNLLIPTSRSYAELFSLAMCICQFYENVHFALQTSAECHTICILCTKFKPKSLAHSFTDFSVQQ